MLVSVGDVSRMAWQNYFAQSFPDPAAKHIGMDSECRCGVSFPSSSVNISFAGRVLWQRIVTRLAAVALMVDELLLPLGRRLGQVMKEHAAQDQQLYQAYNT